MGEWDVVNNVTHEDLIKKHFPAEAVPIATKVVQAESSANPFAKNVNTNNTQDSGLFQINDSNIPVLRKAGIILNRQDLFDPETNVKAAAYLHQQDGFKPWKASQTKWGQTENNNNDWTVIDSQPIPQQTIENQNERPFLEDQKALTHFGPAQITTAQPPTLFDKLKSRVQNVGSEFMNHPSGQGFGVPDPIHVAGQVAGGINDVVGSAASGIYNTIMPDKAKEAISNFASAAFDPNTPNNPIGGALGSAARGAMKIFKKVKDVSPETAKYIEDTANIAGAVPIVKGAVGTVQGAKSLYKKAGEAITSEADKAIVAKPLSVLEKHVAKYDDELKGIVAKHISTAAKPTTIGKNNFGKMKAYEDNSIGAVEGIVKNKADYVFERNGKKVVGQVPSTLEETAQAIEHGKRKALREASALAEQAGDKGAIVTGKQTAAKLTSIVEDTKQSPAVRSSAKKLRDWIAENPNMTPLEAEDLIRSLNQEAKAWHRSGELNSSAHIADEAARGLRQEMMDVLKDAGPAWQDARNKVRDFMSIEKDVNKSWGVDKRKQPFGFFDLGNIYTAGELTTALATGNLPAAFRAGGAGAIKAYMKFVNQKNTQISRMFQQAEKVIARKDKLNSIIEGKIPPTPEPKIKMNVLSGKGTPFEEYAPMDAQQEAFLRAVRQGENTYNNPLHGYEDVATTARETPNPLSWRNKVTGSGMRERNISDVWAKDKAKVPGDIQWTVGDRPGKLQIPISLEEFIRQLKGGM